ncbi:hypothetical protein [Mycobacterium gordonae]|jgi:hypothetical protein|uniref:hypothetical protein n=1 Tax=Mycobacterium gordonae TaxID=1778 RepID=UPI0012E3A83B|nr:hypothetical protein [Mycobacterium gordonae]
MPFDHPLGMDVHSTRFSDHCDGHAAVKVDVTDQTTAIRDCWSFGIGAAEKDVHLKNVIRASRMIPTVFPYPTTRRFILEHRRESGCRKQDYTGLVPVVDLRRAHPVVADRLIVFRRQTTSGEVAGTLNQPAALQEA